jgi:oxygen-dependent protoporphyrinogen oxidase
MTRVGIVGAGITGLALTHHLAERGVDAVTFEATDRPGGVIRTGHVDGAVLEWGPQRLRLTDPVRDLVDAAGIAGEVIRADPDLPMYVYANGDLGEVPLSVRAFLRTDLLSIRGKLRVLAEPLTAAGRPEETAADLFVRKFGREAYENAIGPLFGGIYASDPAEMPVRHSLSGLLRLESESGSLLRAAVERLRGDRAPAAAFEDGMGRLPEALAARHGDRIRFETPVESVTRADGDGNGRYLIRTRSPWRAASASGRRAIPSSKAAAGARSPRRRSTAARSRLPDSDSSRSSASRACRAGISAGSEA